MFPTKFMKASDVEDEPTTVTVAGVEAVELDDGTKYALSFEESGKQLILNVTNGRTIEKLYGDETDDWIGKRITLFAAQVEFKGDQVMAVRVSLKKPPPVGISEGDVPF